MQMNHNINGILMQLCCHEQKLLSPVSLSNIKCVRTEGKGPLDDWLGDMIPP